MTGSISSCPIVTKFTRPRNTSNPGCIIGNPEEFEFENVNYQPRKQYSERNRYFDDDTPTPSEIENFYDTTDLSLNDSDINQFM